MIIKDISYNTSWIKIGKTTRPLQRLKEYNSSFPEDRITYTFLSEPMYNLSACEAMLLTHLRKQKTIQAKQEWFKHSGSCGSPEILIRISSLLLSIHGIICKIQK